MALPPSPYYNPLLLVPRTRATAEELNTELQKIAAAFNQLPAPGAIGTGGGLPNYTWFAYADSADGTANFSNTTPGTRTYVGIAANRSTPTRSTHPEDYEWARIGGAGAPGNDGYSNALVYLFKRGVTAPAVPAATLTYTFSTGLLSGGSLSGWSQTPPTGTDPLYVTAASAVSTDGADTIEPSEWASPVVQAAGGGAGADGLNAATLYLYKRATSAPAVPAGTLTYTFATGILSGSLSGWTQSVPSGTDPIYVITATAISASPTDSIPTGEWASPNILAQNGIDGATGSNGYSNALIYLFQRAGSPPAVPSTTLTYTFSTGALSGTLGSWSRNVPSGSNPLYVTVASASSQGPSDTIASGEWSAPVVQTLDGIDGLNAATVFLYKRGTSAPAVPAATLTYTFATGILSGSLSGWSQTVPSGTDPIYVTTATAASATATDTLPTGEWATPNVLAQNGVSPPLISLSASSQQVNYDKDGALVAGQTITLNSVRQNSTATPLFTFYDTSGAVTLGPASALSFATTYPLSFSTTGVDNLTITAGQLDYEIVTYGGFSIEAAIGSVKDRVSVVKVQDGADGADGDPGAPGISALKAIATPASVTVACTANGTPKAAIPSFVISATQAGADVTGSITYGTITSSNMSGVSRTGNTISATGMSADSGSITVPITGGGSADSVTVPFTKSKDGAAYVADNANVSAPTGSYSIVSSVTLLMGPGGDIEIDTNGGFGHAGGGSNNVDGYFEYSVNGGGYTSFGTITGNAAISGSPGDWSQTASLVGTTIGLTSRVPVTINLQLRKIGAPAFNSFGGSLAVSWAG